MDPDATAKLGGGAGGPAASVSSTVGGYLGIKLTQTGAVLGTPAYMAPEQFAGTSGDARTDQFAFCVALYEGLYGSRPFAGDNARALMTSVVTGTISDPPPDARVPAWIRRILLRGLSTRPDDRFPSMTELLAALGHDPAVRRRRWLAAAGGAIVDRVDRGGHASFHDRRARDLRRGAQPRGDGLGPRTAPGDRGGLLGERQPARGAGVRRRRVALRSVRRALDGDVPGDLRGDAARGEQSAEVLDLRMACLGERMSSVRALTDVFATASAVVVDNAVGAASALPTLDRCADVAMLRAVIKPPEDPAVRAQVAAARQEVAKVRALGDSGQCDRATKAGEAAVARAGKLGYLPLEAEASYAMGRLSNNCLDPAKATGHLEEAVLAAESSRHDEIAIDASLFLAGAYADRLHDVRMARHWLRLGEAKLARFPGHPLLEAWAAVSRGIIFQAQGRYEDALREGQRALALKESLLGPSNVDVASSLMNVGLVLHDLGRDAEADVAMRRAIDSQMKLLGEDNTAVAVALLDESEILTSLRRFDAARAAIEKAIAILERTRREPVLQRLRALRPRSARARRREGASRAGDPGAGRRRPRPVRRAGGGGGPLRPRSGAVGITPPAHTGCRGRAASTGHAGSRGGQHPGAREHGHLADRARGALSGRRSTQAGSGTGMSPTWIPHSLFSGSSHHQRPARGCSPGLTARVQGAQPIDG